ncbi:MAG: dihydroneopterin aldolase [Cyanobacteriota bacterium ELA615]
MVDIIEISNLRCYGYVGYFPEEKVLGQWFEVNARISYDLARAGQTDQLTDTLNYAQVIELIKEKIAKSQFALIERLAQVIAQDILEIPLVTEVKLKLTKLSPPIADFSGQVSVEITRSNIRI